MADALPLVTLTLTTDEMAKCSAGLIQLRRLWAAKCVDEPVGSLAHENALQTVQECTNLINRISELVSPEQGADLLRGLIRGRIERGTDD